MYLNQCLEVFITEKKLDDCTPSTITFYEYTVKKLISFIKEKEEGDIPVSQIHQYIQPYFLYLKTNSNLSPHSYNTFIRGVKVFTRFLYSEGYIDSEIKLPKIRTLETNIKPLTLEEIRILLSSFDENTFIGLRDKTIFSLFLDTGIRLGELCGIQLQDIDLKEGFLTVTGKGRKTRFVPIGRDMKKLLWRYMKQRNLYVLQGDYTLFISQKGEGMTSYGVQTLFRRVKKGLGWNKLNPHLMRHSFSVNFINNGGDSFSLQRILGHHDISMTSRYVNLSTKNIKSQHNRFSPIDNI